MMNFRLRPNRLAPVFALVSLALIAGGVSPVRAQAPSPSSPAQSTQPAPATPAPPSATEAAPKPAAQAAPPLPPEILDPVQRLSKSVETAEKSIQQLKEIEGELTRLRTDVERIIYESTSTAENLRPQLDEVRRQIEKLGPPPAKDQPPESETIAAERARLNQQAAALDGAIKTTELAWVRAKQLIDRITVIRYQQFTRNLFERRDSPLKPQVWRDVADRAPSIIGRLQYYGGDWLYWFRQSVTTAIGSILAASLVGFAMFAFVSGKTRASLAHTETSPTFFERAAKASWQAPLLALPLILAATAIYLGFDSVDLLFTPWSAPANVMLQGAIVYAIASALITVALRPSHPRWRLIPVSDTTARRLSLIMRAFLVVYLIDTIMIEFTRLLYVPLAVTVVLSFVTSMMFFGLLVWLLLLPFEPQIGADRPVNGHVYVPGPVSRSKPLWLKLPLWVISLAIPVSSVVGYVALGRFISHQLVLSGIVLSAAGVAYLAIRAATRDRIDGQSPLSRALETRLGIEPHRRRQVARLTEFLGTVLLLLLAIPVLLLQWGFSTAEIRAWFTALLFGFEIGQFRISLVRILLGIALFVGLLVATRMVQRWLRADVLAQPRMDPGIANSVDTAVGYLGTGLAALLAVSYAGFDITSLAIVAGALSVGIGFGLQSIVNNFVSGLILLVERPVKVGDWIVVGNEQGNVRRISVRSTEIETFDRASLIVPNSELITGRVLNWTHRNLLGRVLVRIPLTPVEDPQAVIDILVDVARENPGVMTTPPPNATLDQITTTTHEFTLRATLSDVTSGVVIQSQLRLEILRRLRDAGLYKPQPIAVPVAIAQAEKK